MLQTQTISSELLELLKKIMKSDIFSDFILVGGTALALQIGHRNSVDIDLFGNCELDEESFVSELKKMGQVKLIHKSKNVIMLSVDNIKVDFVSYKYPLLENFQSLDNIRLASKKDIAAMKLNAISGRGNKKDFIDLFFLLDFFTLDEMIKFYDEKFEEGSYFLVMKSLTYFQDADSQQSPEIFKKFDWDVAKDKIKEEFLKL